MGANLMYLQRGPGVHANLPSDWNFSSEKSLGFGFLMARNLKVETISGTTCTGRAHERCVVCMYIFICMVALIIGKRRRYVEI